MTPPLTHPPLPKTLTEDEWKSREAWFRQLMEASNDGFWEWNIQTGEVQFSGRWAKMLGYQTSEIEPHVRSWEMLVHPDDMPGVREVLDRHLRGERGFYETEHRLRTKSGEWRWILDHGRVLEWDAEGKPLRAAGAHIDIHDRKLREMEKEQISKSRLEILGVVSHELKNPLHALLLSIDLERSMIQQSLLPATIAPILDGMRKSVWRMQRLVSDLLDVTRLEADPLPLQISRVGAQDLCMEAITLAQPRAEERRIKIERKFDPAGAALQLEVDSLRIIQVLANLLENAIKFSPEGSTVWLKTATQLGSNPPALTFVVEDQGPGVPVESRTQIFDRFWQARKDAYKGTGLGLYIAQGILRSHHGEIQVEDRPGGGSRFFFTLPARSEEREKPPQRSAA